MDGSEFEVKSSPDHRLGPRLWRSPSSRCPAKTDCRDDTITLKAAGAVKHAVIVEAPLPGKQNAKIKGGVILVPKTLPADVSAEPKEVSAVVELSPPPPATTKLTTRTRSLTAARWLDVAHESPHLRPMSRSMSMALVALDAEIGVQCPRACTGFIFKPN